MIFVTFGTQDKEFKRPLEELDRLIEKGLIKDEIVVQAGFTKYKSDNMNIVDYMDTKAFKKHIEKCDLLITHGGVGSISDGLNYNKKIIAIPRLKKYNEHVNDHQLDIVNEFYKLGYLLKVDDIAELGTIIKNAKNFKPTKVKHNSYQMIKLIEDFINNN